MCYSFVKIKLLRNKKFKKIESVPSKINVEPP